MSTMDTEEAEIHELDAWALADEIRSGARKATEVVAHHLERIERLDPALSSFVFLDQEAAYKRAGEIDQLVEKGVDPGPLAGVPLGIKELHAVEGWPLTSASVYFADKVAARTSTMVARAIEAGAVPIGLTASPELGRASYCASRLHGVTNNPWNTERTPGGSSGGSTAAVVAGLVPLATASDGAGSIRIPASFCGLVGFKPTFGLISRGPSTVNSGNSTANGVVSRGVRDTARYLDCVVGVDERDAASLPSPGFRFEDRIDEVDLHGVRFLWSENLGFAPCNPEVARVTREAAESLLRAIDGVLVDAPLSLGDLSSIFNSLTAVDMRNQIRNADYGDLENLDPTIRRYVQPELTVDDVAQAHVQRGRLVEDLADAFLQADFILTPATQTTAFAAAGPMPSDINGIPVSWLNSIGLTYAFNLSGHPAISVPAGLIDGLPIGLQIVGRRHDDLRVLALAAVLERVRPWHKLAPYSRSMDRV